MAAKGRLKFQKVLGRDNPADLFTKYLDERTSSHHLENLAFKFTEGRATEAPKLHTLSRSRYEYEDGESYNGCEWVNTVLRKTSDMWMKMQKVKCNENHNDGDKLVQATLREEQM